MVMQEKFVVVQGGKSKSNGKGAATSGIVTCMQATGEIREATTGQVVRLARVWAVAEPQSGPQPASRKAVQTAPQGEMAFYRKYTEALLRRYVQMTMEAGRVSSMMGREVLGGKASSYRIHGFDDAVIFRLDVEKCLRQLDGPERMVIRRIAMQEYTHLEAAELLELSLRTVGSRYAKALDRLTGILLKARLLEPLAGCQVGCA